MTPSDLQRSRREPLTTALITGATTAIGRAISRTVATDERFGRAHLLVESESARGLQDLVRSVDTVFHCAEDSNLDAALPEARIANVDPLKALLPALEKAPSTRLVHLSTTWICGTKRGLFTEFDLDCQQRFCNAYEQSKYEAELLLRQSAVSARTTIVRRSLVVDTMEIEPGSFTVNAWLDSLRDARRLLVAGDPQIRIDLVPLDYVSAAAVALSLQPAAAGRTAHLVAGWEKSWTLEALAAALTEFAGLPPIGFVRPLLTSWVKLLGRLSLGRVAVLPPGLDSLRPYLRQRAVFDQFLASKLLQPLGLTCPHPSEFLSHVLARSARHAGSEITKTLSLAPGAVDTSVKPEERSVQAE